MKTAPGMDSEKLLDELLDRVGIARKSLYAVSEVAQILGMCAGTVRRLCDQKPGTNGHRLRAIRTPGGQRRIPQQALLSWLASEGDDYA
ncbi:MAG: helix-turn-helix domain-containing protein [Nitrospinota bacterium]|nr:helix-turn-helix domain-containing protein [Nitrospinota bacterium]